MTRKDDPYTLYLIPDNDKYTVTTGTGAAFLTKSEYDTLVELIDVNKGTTKPTNDNDKTLTYFDNGELIFVIGPDRVMTRKDDPYILYLIPDNDPDNDNDKYAVTTGTGAAFLTKSEYDTLVELIDVKKGTTKPTNDNDKTLTYFDNGELIFVIGPDRVSRAGGSRRRRPSRPSRKYKKSAKRVFRKKSRSTRRR